MEESEKIETIGNSNCIIEANKNGNFNKAIRNYNNMSSIYTKICEINTLRNMIAHSESFDINKSLDYINGYQFPEGVDTESIEEEVKTFSGNINQFLTNENIKMNQNGKKELLLRLLNYMNRSLLFAINDGVLNYSDENLNYGEEEEKDLFDLLKEREKINKQLNNKEEIANKEELEYRRNELNSIAHRMVNIEDKITKGKLEEIKNDFKAYKYSKNFENTINEFSPLFETRHKSK